MASQWALNGQKVAIGWPLGGQIKRDTGRSHKGNSPCPVLSAMAADRSIFRCLAASIFGQPEGPLSRRIHFDLIF